MVLVEKEREEDMLRKGKRRRYVKKFNLFIIIIFIILHQMHFVHFTMYLSEYFLDFFHFRLIEKILSRTIM